MLSLLATACGVLDGEEQASPASDYYDYSSADTSDDSGASSDDGYEPPVSYVCVAYERSRLACSGMPSDYEKRWRCSNAAQTLDECHEMYEHDVSCGGGCCSEYNYSYHEVVEGTCKEALAAKRNDNNGGSTGGGGSGGGDSGGSDGGDEDCSACADICVKAGFNAWVGTCDADACQCTSQNCGTCGDTCLNDGFTGFSGQCKLGGEGEKNTCYCSDKCGSCEDTCLEAGAVGFGGTCTEETCYCEW